MTTIYILSFNQLFVILPDLKTIIGTVYIRPTSSISLYQEHIMHVKDLKNIFLDHNLVLTGDYNLPSISWNTSTTLTKLPKSCASVLVGSFKDLCLSQFNYISNSKNNILDFCFSNLFCNISISNDILSNKDELHLILNIILSILLETM